MKRPALVCWWKQWDASGRVVREMFRPVDGQPIEPQAPAPAIARGVAAHIEPKQGTLI